MINSFYNINNILMSTLGTRTILLRKALGLTQKEFSKIGDLSQSNLSLAENDGVFSSVHFFIKLKENFPNINMNWWLAAEGSIFLKTDSDLAIEANIDPGIKKFLSEMRAEISNMGVRNKIIMRKKKDQ